MSSCSWGPGFCSPLNSRDSHWLSSRLQFFLSFCSVCMPWWPAGKRSGSPRAVGQFTSGCWGMAPLQLSACSHAARHFLSLLCSPSVPRNVKGLGSGGWSLKYPKQEERQVTVCQTAVCMASTEGGCGMPQGMVKVISGKKYGSKLPSTLLAVGTSFSSQEQGQSFNHWPRFLCLYFLCLYPSQGNLASKQR